MNHSAMLSLNAGDSLFRSYLASTGKQRLLLIYKPGLTIGQTKGLCYGVLLTKGRESVQTRMSFSIVLHLCMFQTWLFNSIFLANARHFANTDRKSCYFITNNRINSMFRADKP
jgi:hypothetical protein